MYDVIVVGARCAGAPLAMLLARAGHSVLLLDRSRFPSDTMSTHWILHPGVELLASWGLLDQIVASGCPPITRIRMDFGDTVLAGVPASSDGPAVTFAPRRIVLDELLVEAARCAGAQVREEFCVRDVLWADGTVVGVTGYAGNGRTVTERAHLVVGADGRNSTIARAVRAGMVDDRGALASTAYTYWSGMSVDGVEGHFHTGLGVSLWPTHDDLVVVGVVLPRQEFFAHQRGAEHTYLQTLRRIPELAERMADGCRESPVRAATNLRNFYRRSHGPGWALIGDAGYHQDSIGAHGISNAFSDAQSLAELAHRAFIGDISMQRSLARYEALRNAGRSAAFEFTCNQASLRPLDVSWKNLLIAAHRSTQITQQLLGVFAGGQRIEEFFAPANLARITEHCSKLLITSEPAHPARNRQVEQDQVDEWQQIYDWRYETSGSAVFGQDFTGWNSSYDRQPIPAAHVRDWCEQTVARILSLRPRQVLEVGAGTGLLLSRLAPHCDIYWATDFSATAIDTLSNHIEQDPGLAARVVLRTQPAHNTDGLPAGVFDTVILNSVVQYFPTTDYLVEVLTRLLGLVAPGGVVFLGDVRNLRLLRCLATAAELHRAEESTEPAILRRTVEQTVLAERELLIDPDFFPALQNCIPDIAGVDIQTKRGRHDNELSRYRYDVALHKHPITPLPLGQAPRLSWGHQISGLSALDDYLTSTRPTRLRITGVPNNRILGEVALAHALQAGAPLAALLEHLHAPHGTAEVADPEAFHELGQRRGYWVGVTWSPNIPEALEILLADTAEATSAVPIDLYTPASDTGTPLSSLTNNPTAARHVGTH